MYISKGGPIFRFKICQMDIWWHGASAHHGSGFDLPSSAGIENYLVWTKFSHPFGNGYFTLETPMSTWHFCYQHHEETPMSTWHFAINTMKRPLCLRGTFAINTMKRPLCLRGTFAINTMRRPLCLRGIFAINIMKISLKEGFENGLGQESIFMWQSCYFTISS